MQIGFRNKKTLTSSQPLNRIHILMMIMYSKNMHRRNINLYTGYDYAIIIELTSNGFIG